jgi:undecaprenyl diphosphate synthase
MDGNGPLGRTSPSSARHRPSRRRARREQLHRLLHRARHRALTLFAFSSENWGRPEDEVGALMKLFLNALDREVDELHRRGVRVRFIGERERFGPAIGARMAAAEALTVGNGTLHLTIAASYGGRWDIANAARRLAEDVAAGRLRPEDIDETSLGARNRARRTCPPPDLFIRTGGDLRISNFLLWQLAYTELWFTETLWPDVDAATLRQALADYAMRERRFGLTGAQATATPQRPSQARIDE